MNKEILAFLTLLPGSLLLAYLLTNPVTITLAIMITLFYGVQIIGTITILLHKKHPAVIPLTICYVCAAVGGTWIFGGLIPLLLGEQLIPKLFILYLAGQSALAIAQGSNYIWQLPTQELQQNFAYLILIAIGVIELLAGYFFTQHNLLTIILVYIAGVGTLKTAELFDRYRKRKHEETGSTYLNREENIAILIITVSILTGLHLFII